MRRREFIPLLGGAAATWPNAAWAQQSNRMKRIGVLMGPAEDDPESNARVTAFRGDLRGSAGRKASTSTSITAMLLVT
jgi:putative tryptophan/tyrosine transport system substrate-binding protein